MLEAAGLSVRFGGVHAVRDVGMSVAGGEVCGLIGPNGAGKTTLFDVLSGVRQPSTGRVVLDGEDITRRSATWRARHGIRRTFQRQQLFGGLSVEDNVLAALDWQGGGGGVVADLVAAPTRRSREQERRDIVTSVIADYGLADVRTVSAESVPIGAARLIELARAVVDDPRVLLLDEPTSGLDEGERDRLGALIQEQRRRGAAVVLVEHDIEFVMAQCDRVVVLNLGEVIADDTPTVVRDDPRVIAAYLT